MVSEGMELIGLELLVESIPPAVELFVDGMGCALAWEGRAVDVDGDVAVLDAGPIAITLIAPTMTGGPPIPDSAPRLSQLVFGASGTVVDQAISRLQGLGMAVSSEVPGRPFVPPEAAAGPLGLRTALVLSVLGDPESGRPDPQDGG